MDICEENYNDVLNQASWFRGFLDALIDSDKISISQTKIMREQMNKLLFCIENIEICDIADIYDTKDKPWIDELGNNMDDEIPF